MKLGDILLHFGVKGMKWDPSLLTPEELKKQQDLAKMDRDVKAAVARAKATAKSRGLDPRAFDETPPGKVSLDVVKAKMKASKVIDRAKGDPPIIYNQAEWNMAKQLETAERTKISNPNLNDIKSKKQLKNEASKVVKDVKSGDVSKAVKGAKKIVTDIKNKASFDIKEAGQGKPEFGDSKNGPSDKLIKAVKKVKKVKKALTPQREISVNGKVVKDPKEIKALSKIMDSSRKEIDKQKKEKRKAEIKKTVNKVEKKVDKIVKALSKPLKSEPKKDKPLDKLKIGKKETKDILEAQKKALKKLKGK